MSISTYATGCAHSVFQSFCMDHLNRLLVHLSKSCSYFMPPPILHLALFYPQSSYVSFSKPFKALRSAVSNYCFPITPYLFYAFYPFSKNKPISVLLIDGLPSPCTLSSFQCFPPLHTKLCYYLQPTTVMLQHISMTQIFLLCPYFISSMSKLSWPLQSLALEFPLEFLHLIQNLYFFFLLVVSSIFITLLHLTYFFMASSFFLYLSFLLLQNA